MKSGPKPVVLFVDDDAEATNALIKRLRRHESSCVFHSRTSAQDALIFLENNSPEVAVVDLSLDPSAGPESGLNCIEQLLLKDPTLRVIVLTGHEASQYGINAMHVGAASFVQKPVEPSHLDALIQDSVQFSRLQRKYKTLSSSPEHLANIKGLQSKSESMKPVLEAVAFASSSKQPILLIGETGSGKGVIAQAIHLASGSSGQFVRFQPSFGSADLVSSELFGHKRGAFTGATENRDGLLKAAHGGTLFLDEIDELPKETQVVMLNALQEKVFRPLGTNKDVRSDFRLIAATNRHKEELLSGKYLRPDFYHRIAHVEIQLPALRERAEDIPQLADEFVLEAANRENLSIHGITSRALARLKSYPWPGNIRELQAKLEIAAFRASYHGHRYVEVEDLNLGHELDGIQGLGLSFRERVKMFERKLAEEALAKHENNQTKAAESLQLDRTSFRRIITR